MQVMMKRRSLLAALGAAVSVPARAADPWNKPPAQWTEKDIRKILTNSPWSREVTIALGTGIMAGGGRRGGRGGGGFGGAMPDASVGAGSEGVMGGGRPGMGEGMSGTMAPSVRFQIRWQSAKPIKLATVRARMGAEADSSPQAREFIEREEPDYVIAVIGPPMGLMAEGQDRTGQPPRTGVPPQPAEGAAQGRRSDLEQWMAALRENTWLAWKEHAKLHPSSVSFPPGGQHNVLIFHFPKVHPIELEEKEVEFCMRRGRMEVKRTFKLRDMVFEGKLAL